MGAVLAVLDVRRRRQVDARRQADLIGAWTDVDRIRVDEGGAGFRCRVHVANRSYLPIVRVCVKCALLLGQDEGHKQFWHSIGLGAVESDVVGTRDLHDSLG